MSKRGIKGKVSNLVFIVSAAAIVLVSIVSFIQVFGMKTSTMEISNSLGIKAAQGSEEALEDLALSQLKSLTISKTQYADAKIQSVIDQCILITGMAEKIFNSPESFSDRYVERPLAENAGIPTAQLLHAETMADGAEEEMAKIANLAEVIVNSTSCNSSVITSQVASDKGYIIMGDTDSDTKADIEYLDPRERSWFQKAKDVGTMVFSDIVDDAFGRGLGFVCANPIFDYEGTFRGVVGVSSFLTELSTTITNDQLSESAYTFALDGKGNVIISPTLTKMEDSENYLESTDPDAVTLAKKMIAKENGVDKITLDGKEVYVAYSPLNVVDWSICTVIGVDDVLQPAVENATEITVMTTDAVNQIDQSIMYMLIIFIAVILVAMVCMTFISSSFAKRLTRPIEDLTKSVHEISDGNLDYTSSIKTGDEIETLSDSFETMTNRLKSYIDNITKITAEKERMGAELNVAARIQVSQLPHVFPDRKEFSVFATMNPAKEVGGDFYDVFMIDDDHLALVMADVSGKGVPGAMFMMTAKTLIDSNSMDGKSPAEIFTAVNASLCEHNEAEMFVTAFIAVLEISTGKFTYCNAGHNPPLIKKADGKFEWLKARAGFVLAGMEGIKYRQAELTLGKGDIFFTYTDGVTEAVNPALELYSDPRLINTLNAANSDEMSTEEICEYINADIGVYADGAEQADDITVLALKYFGKE